MTTSASITTPTESITSTPTPHEEEIGILARAMKSLAFNSDRLYIDPQDGRLKVHPRNYIDDS